MLKMFRESEKSKNRKENRNSVADAQFDFILLLVFLLFRFSSFLFYLPSVLCLVIIMTTIILREPVAKPNVLDLIYVSVCLIKILSVQIRNPIRVKQCTHLTKRQPNEMIEKGNEKGFW